MDQVKLLVLGGYMEAVFGQVCPLSKGNTVHNVPVLPDFLRCYIDKVLPGFKNVPFCHVREDDEHNTLKTIELLFVQ